jgi:multicomponent Na+:H+ antiporter subunit B
MIWELDLLIFAILIVTAVLALRVRNMVTAVVVLAAYSLFAALLFAGMGAVDVAFVEAVLGFGVTGLLLIAAVVVVGRDAEGREPRRRRWAMLPLVVGFVTLMLYASVDLPDRADPDAPGHLHVAPVYLQGALEDSETPNVVTAILADYRAHDTLGETVVIFTAGLACVLVLARRQKP